METHCPGTNGAEWANIPPIGHNDYRKYPQGASSERPLWTTYGPLRVKGYILYEEDAHMYMQIYPTIHLGTKSFSCTLMIAIGANLFTDL